MKGLFFLFLVIFVSLNFISCEQVIPDLPRDNPYDDSATTIERPKVDIIFTKYEIVNIDTASSSWPSVSVKIYLKNIGLKSTQNLLCDFSSTFLSAYIYTPGINYGILDSNEESYGNGIGDFSFSFNLTSAYVVGTKIPINLKMTDGPTKYQNELNINIIPF
jgi:hypothetical protein